MATAPLRYIVGYTEEHIAPGVWALREVLECGHIVPIKKDIYGETNAVRRRCRHCQKSATAS